MHIYLSHTHYLINQTKQVLEINYVFNIY